MDKLLIALLLSLISLGLSAKEITFVTFSEDPWPPYTYGKTDVVK